MVCRLRSLLSGLRYLLIASCVGVQAQEAPLEKAWKLAANGDHLQAIGVLKDLLQRDPANVDAHLLLGSLFSEDGKNENAVTELTEAVRLRPKSSEAVNALGEAYNKAGELPEARQAFEKAVALQPSFAVAQENLGAILLQQGDTLSAARHLDLAIPLLADSPDAADAEYLRAKICSSQDDFNAAARHLERAVTLRPDYAEAWSDLGFARKANGDDPGALAAYGKAVQLNPEGAVAQYRLGSEYLHSGKPDLALAPLEVAHRLAPEDQSTLNALQSTLQQLHRPVDAAAIRAQLAELLRNRDIKRQNQIKALQINNNGAALEKSGKLKEAIALYQKAVLLSPEHSGMRTNYGMALLRVGEWTQGLTELHQALALDPHNRELRLVLQDALSKAPRQMLPEWAKATQ